MVRDRLNNSLKVGNLKNIFCDALEISVSDMRAQFHNIEHHHAHLASAFFVSPFEEAAVLSVDGMGDFVSTMWAVGKGNEIQVKGEINFPHSLGIFYTALTQWLGFPKFGDEGKVMGLAPYGRPAYMDQMRQIVKLQQDGTFELDLDYFVHHAEGATMTWDGGEPQLGSLFSQRMVEVFGQPREYRGEISQHHRDVAASLQQMLEEAELALLRQLEKETVMAALCMAGGVSLNSCFNGKIRATTGFRHLFIQAAAGDAGTALGVCYYIYHQMLGNPRCFKMEHAYTGNQFGNGDIEAAIRRANLKSRILDAHRLIDRCVEILTRGDVLGWFQGRMEWGPRALGNRSILADPRREDMKDILNARIKHREKFRPFAPSILIEETGNYFDQTYPDPFMIKVYNVLPDRRAEIPAVTHVDGTGRLQTVDKVHAPLYWNLIRRFGDITGTPVLLNTSFNENEPIVCTPQEAIDCFMRTRMDALALGNHLIEK
jgi:carbamoyltransferase